MASTNREALIALHDAIPCLLEPTSREALTALYNATGGPAWENSENWNTDADPSLWYGVTIELSNVEELRMMFDDPQDPVPEALGGQGDVRVLDMSGNQLIGSIPPELGNLTALSCLNLAGNQLHGHIPKEFGDLGNLEWLHLQRNQLSGPIPPEIGKLGALQGLNLYGNQLSGHIPKQLGDLSNLQSLGLQANKLTGTIPMEIGKLTTLNELDLSGNRLTGSVPAQLAKLEHLYQLDLGGNQLSGPVPSARQLRDLHRALFSPSSMVKETVGGGMINATGRQSEAGEEEPAVSGATKKRKLGEAESKAGDDTVTGTGDKMATITDFKGFVVAWSFGRCPDVLCGDDGEFELELPDLGRNVPALVGLRSSAAQVVEGKQCLLHPIVTCLAREGEAFDPPLRLRFPVGDEDSMESGSDCGTPDAAEVAYRAYLESTFSAWTRKDARSGWVPIDGAIKQVEGGEFVLEVEVFHFCDFALRRDIEVSGGGVELIELPRLKRKSRRSHYHFVNRGTEDLVAYCWGAARREAFVDSFRLKLGIGPTSGDGEVAAKRTLVDAPDTGVYSVEVSGAPDGKPREVACLVVDGHESLTVAYTTQETIHSVMGGTHELVQVWGRRTMQHKQAMIFGAGSKRLVPNLKVEDGVNVGELVRSKVG